MRGIESEHNHFDIGHVGGLKPEAYRDKDGKEYERQKCWEKYEWIKSFGYLVDGKVIK